MQVEKLAKDVTGNLVQKENHAQYVYENIFNLYSNQMQIKTQSTIHHPSYHEDETNGNTDYRSGWRKWVLLHFW